MCTNVHGRKSSDDIKLKYANEAYDNQKAIDEKAAADEKALNEKTKADALENQQAKVQFANDSLFCRKIIFHIVAGLS